MHRRYSGCCLGPGARRPRPRPAGPFWANFASFFLLPLSICQAACSAVMATQRLSQAAILSAPAAAPVASRSLAEARARARSFFREICREVPWVVKNYQLGEITTVGRLRSQLATHFRRVETDNPKVIDLMLFKGQAEVHEMMAHYTQRHHLVRARFCGSVRRKRAPLHFTPTDNAPRRRLRATWRRLTRRARGRSGRAARATSLSGAQPAQAAPLPLTPPRCPLSFLTTNS